jgi:gliding motility-associated-like protein
MSDKLEKAFREALGNHEMPFEAAAWTAVSKKLPVSKAPWYWIGGAATLVLLIVGAVVLFPNNAEAPEAIANTEIQEDIVPVNDASKALEPQNQSIASTEIIVNHEKPVVHKEKDNLTTEQVEIPKIAYDNTPFSWQPRLNNPRPVVSDGDNKNPQAMISGLHNYYCENNRVVLFAHQIPDGYTFYWELSDHRTLQGERIEFTAKEGLKVRLVLEDTRASYQHPWSELNVVKPELVSVEQNQVIKNTKTYVELSNTNPYITNLVWRFENKVCQDQVCGTYLTTQGAHTYTVESYDQKGCYAKFEGSVELKEDYNLFAENSFTPNGDGLNDYFMPQALAERSVNFKLQIMDRFGKVIYQTSNANEPWDGTSSGQTSPTGVYIWSVTLINEEGQPEQYKGHITVIR